MTLPIAPNKKKFSELEKKLLDVAMFKCSLIKFHRWIKIASEFKRLAQEELNKDNTVEVYERTVDQLEQHVKDQKKKR